MSTDTFDMAAEEILFPTIDDDPDFFYEDTEGDLDDPFEAYCDLCERTGHTFRCCPARDDDVDAHLDDMGD